MDSLSLVLYKGAMQRLLLEWFRKNARPLPWRKDKEPYRVWVSEVMLQQTTVVAVLPFYERFMERFPNLSALAKSRLEDVYEHWSGLGYYSRARNLHRAAQALAKEGFPENAAQLQELPGFGPYTSRAVASIAFGEKVGVVDGNVIRVLSRFWGLTVPWWTPAGRQILQSKADELAQHRFPGDINQALMELGATICTPRSPVCSICPWLKSCHAAQKGMIEAFPLKRPRKEKQIWIWDVKVIEKKGQVLFQQNDYAPFLRQYLLPPGHARPAAKAPKRFAFQHSITHHQIFVRIERSKTPIKHDKAQWISIGDVPKKVPASLVRKVLRHAKP